MAARELTDAEPLRWPEVAAMTAMALALNAAMAAGLGAKYWYDTIAYAQLATAIADSAALRQLYEGQFGITYQHLMPGLPLLMALFERIFGAFSWPAFAVMQYGLNALASVWFANSLRRQLTFPSRIVLVALISLFPFYSAFHGAFLTESLTATLFLVIAGTAFRQMNGDLGFGRAMAIILVLAVLGGLLRSYLAGIGGVAAVLVILGAKGWRAFGWHGAAIASVLAGFSAFSVWKTALGLPFLLPNVNNWMLNHVTYVVKTLDEPSIRALDGVVFDQAVFNKITASPDRLGFGDMIALHDGLVAKGLTSRQAGEKIAAAANVLRLQSAQDVVTQLQLPLASIGFQFLGSVGPKGRLLTRGGFDAERTYKHLRYYYLWNSGMDGGDYLATYKSYSDRYRSAPGLVSEAAISWTETRIGPHIKARPAFWRTALLPLVMIPADILVLAGLAGFIWLARRRTSMILLVLASIGLVYLAAAMSTVVGDNRHSHLLWPLYLAGIVALVDGAAVRFGKHGKAAA